MLQYSFGLLEEASAVNSAVEKTLAQGFRTADLVGSDAEFSTTQHITDKILENL